MIHSILQAMFTASLIVFMVGNLLAMGLQLRVSDACRPLQSLRFVVTVLIGGFLIGPALALVVVKLVPMEGPYAFGMLLLGLAPAAPFLPLVVKRANGDVATAAGVMLLAALGTILFMPLGVPLFAPGLSASAWSIAKPLLTLVLLPLAVGILLKTKWQKIADRLYGPVKNITGLGTLAFLALVVVLNFKAFIGSVGSHALLAQLIYVPLLCLAGYLTGIRMPPGQRSVLGLGLCTRNIGAAAAVVGPNGDQRTMVMLVMATLVTVAFSFAAAHWFARARSTKKQPPSKPAVTGSSPVSTTSIPA